MINKTIWHHDPHYTETHIPFIPASSAGGLTMSILSDQLMAAAIKQFFGTSQPGVRLATCI